IVVTHWGLHVTSIITLNIIINTAPTAIYTLSLHDALPISRTGFSPWGSRWTPRSSRWNRSGSTGPRVDGRASRSKPPCCWSRTRSEEHTSELQSRENLVCRLLLEKKNNNDLHYNRTTSNNI